MPSLLERIQYENDQLAFRQFYQEHMFRLFQFAYSFLQNKELAEEIVNDVFMSVWLKRSKLDGICNIDAYLYTTVKHASLNQLRSKGISSALELDLLHTDHFSFILDPQTLLLTRELQTAIQDAVNSLPPRCKLIFKLVKEDGLSYKEVADLLDLAVKTVDSQLVIALKKLQEILWPFLREHPVFSRLKKTP